MVEVVPIARALVAAHARDRAVEAVAEPVDGQHHRHEQQRAPVPGRRRERRAGRHGAERAEGGQVIRIDAAGQPVREPDQEPFLGVSQHAAVLADVRGVLGWRLRLRLGDCGHGIPSTDEGAGGGGNGSGRGEAHSARSTVVAMRETPEFVFEFLRWGTAGVVLVVGISVGLFWWLRRWSVREAREHDKKAGAKRRL